MCVPDAARAIFVYDAVLVSQAIEQQHLSKAQPGAQDEPPSESTSYGSDGSSSSGADMDIEVCHEIESLALLRAS